MRSILASAVLFFLSSGPAALAQGRPDFVAHEGQVAFVMPSGNIGCVYTPAGGTSWYQTEDGGPELSCDRVEPAYIRLVLTGSGPAARIGQVGDQGCCGAENPFPYGAVAVLGPFTCMSERRGLTCTRADGHGFFVSRAVSEAY
jgi:hypothetical protein